MKWALRVLAFAGLVILSLSVASVALTPESIQPNQHNDGAVIRIYGADVWGIRGRFAIHNWIATKAADVAQTDPGSAHLPSCCTRLPEMKQKY